MTQEIPGKPYGKPTKGPHKKAPENLLITANPLKNHETTSGIFDFHKTDKNYENFTKINSGLRLIVVNFDWNPIVACRPTIKFVFQNEQNAIIVLLGVGYYHRIGHYHYSIPY